MNNQQRIVTNKLVFYSLLSHSPGSEKPSFTDKCLCKRMQTKNGFRRSSLLAIVVDSFILKKIVEY